MELLRCSRVYNIVREVSLNLEGKFKVEKPKRCLRSPLVPLIITRPDKHKARLRGGV